MHAPFDVEARWPDLFTLLTKTQRRAAVQAMAAAWHEGWTPTRESVQELTDRARGATTREEFTARVLARHGLTPTAP